MDGDAFVPAPRAAGHRDVDVDAARGPELVERCRRAVRKDRARAAGEDGRHPETLALEQLPGHQGVDGVVLAVEAAGGGSASGPPCTQTERPQLIQPEHARAARSRQLAQGLVEKTTVFRVFSTSLGHARRSCTKSV